MPISRRAFLGAVATAPFLLGSTAAPRVVVVGAGAFGGWTALHLRRLGANVTLLDAWGPGNTRASSGGETRVIRAIYGADKIYVEMVKRSYELWEALDMSSRASVEGSGRVGSDDVARPPRSLAYARDDNALYVETGALWLHRGDDSYVRSSLPSLREFGFAADPIALDDAAKRWPQIDFTGIKSVWLERRAGVLSARRACAVVRDAFVKAGGTYRTEHVKPDAKFDADAVVYACGPWLGKMFAGVPVRPTRQEVFYFGTPSGSDRYAPPRFPVWIDFGERIVYGIPDVHGRGFKVADDTRGDAFDPTDGDRTPSAEGAARVRRVLAERFPELAKAPLLAAEVCQYENSPDGHLIIDRHPEIKNGWVVGGGSGHGFKLGPAVGEMTAQAILRGRSLPPMFALGREAARPKTQFERR